MSQELSNEAPKASRRAILTAAPVAAAAALAGGTVANALAIGMAKVAEADPIFAVIAAHRACIAELCAINDFVMNASDDTVLPEDIDERTNEANDRRMDAELILLTTDPTSVAGVVAALEYLSSRYM
jgi:threonine aldolase